ncbi:hypothetical protein M9H77_07009 [Catharanthus roseus]|uniref:Uncharacterized protein n=1 Tax=Catharanthus roseus TaxID=4058 RepID=A0ACC0BTW9_CATRO|nr:hypothetical protein M9H77_07009 [Catharanthus roseus]
MLCGSGYFLAGWVRRGPPARVEQGGLAGTDYGMLEFVRRPRFRFRTLSVEPIMVPYSTADGTIIRGSAGSTPSSSYFLKEIDPERPSMPVVDILDSDSKTVDGPVSSTSGLPVSSPIAETAGSHFPASFLSLEQRLQAIKNQIATLQAKLARTNTHFHLSCQARQFETARANRLAAEVAQIRGAPEVQRRGTSLQRMVETTSRSANETPAEAEARWRNFSIRFSRQSLNLDRLSYDLDIRSSKY